MRYTTLSLLVIALFITGCSSVEVDDSESYIGFSLDHFKCYHVVGTKIGQDVTLTDQFGTEDVKVNQPREICNPVDKNGEGINDSDATLVCYQIVPRGQFSKREVVVTNQFGEQVLEVVGPRTLCVPSEKGDGEGD